MEIYQSVDGENVKIFPQKNTIFLEPIEDYPVNYFKKSQETEEFTIFCQYLNLKDKKIYYAQRAKIEKYQKHFTDVMKKAMHFRFFNPSKALDWNRVMGKLSKPVEDSTRVNVDTRTCFKFGNKFLVKWDFTFGQRTVPKDKCHVYQTTAVPLLFYLLKSENETKSKRYFPSFDLNYKYDRRVLVANGTFKIPSGTTYVLFAIHNTFFSLDIMTNENFEESLLAHEQKFRQKWHYDDPVSNPVRKLMTDKSVNRMSKTANVENEESDEELFEMQKSLSIEEMPREPIFFEEMPQQQIFIQEMPQQQIFIDEMPQQPQQIFLEAMPQQPQQIFLEAMPQPITFTLPEPPSVFEKHVVVANPDFTRRYRELTFKEYKNPAILPFPTNQQTEQDDEPLDLRTLGSIFHFLEDVVDTSTMEIDQMEQTINELFATNPFTQVET